MNKDDALRMALKTLSFVDCGLLPDLSARTKEVLYAAINEAETKPNGVTNIKRFTVYRRNMSQKDTHNTHQKNADAEPQFEGVIWTDGTVTVRWLTKASSHSVWRNIEDCLTIHGHPEYGTEIVWHDCDPPKFWQEICARYILQISA